MPPGASTAWHQLSSVRCWYLGSFQALQFPRLSAAWYLLRPVVPVWLDEDGVQGGLLPVRPVGAPTWQSAEPDKVDRIA